MTPFVINSCLQSMQILVDSNEQLTARAQRRYQEFSVPYLRQKLDYGDYTYNFMLPDGSLRHQPDVRVYGDVVIERKMSLTELSNNLCQEKARLKREFQRAAKCGAKIYLLVEDASWEKLIAGKYNTRFHPNAYEAALLGIMAEFDISPIFCREETSGRLINDILYRELKKRLERGDYDGEKYNTSIH